jgi:hypothetical protein
MGNNRGTFIRNTAAVLAGSTASPLLAAAARAAIASRPTAAKYALELDGQNAGFLIKVNNLVLSNAAPQPITVEVGAEMSKAFYDWIKDSMNKGGRPESGAIVELDFNEKEIARWAFLKAAISEIGFPALDASSKDEAKMSLAFTPQTLAMTQSSSPKPYGSSGSKGQKHWLPSNFKLSIAGVDCSRVSKVEGLTWKPLAPSPTLSVTVLQSHAQDFVAWQQHPVKKTGTLDYLEPNLQGVLLSLGLSDLMPLTLAQEASASHSDQIQRMKATISCGKLALTTSP